ncbi:IS4 family transposase [Pseudoduganella chitinolytica]|uniref:IS4 family transposase n=1 Tax=Pseudoduganella chitinolytica TaxID=34070 RepID=A0ABY8BCD0_9BURK|nr:IS4 family transposase [Pseudoduganella chitinolytica]WEF32646.1 IS4 family transposase [Pseudoduganella chitinolytica]
MHAQQIIQKFLADQCSAMHAKRRRCLADAVEAARSGGLAMMGMSKALESEVSLRYRIKRIDRLLSSAHLAKERVSIFKALAHHLLPHQERIAVIVDWSDLLPDVSQHLLRAAVVVEGRAITIYEELHPTKSYGSRQVHHRFLETLRTVLPPHRSPVIITDAGFRGTWFQMLGELGYDWIGRIRNLDTVRAEGTTKWQPCKELYPHATKVPRDLGRFEHTQSRLVKCRLTLVKKSPQGRKKLTVFGNDAGSHHSNKQRKGQSEPWLLSVSPGLSKLRAKQIVALYSCRMQIEQTFRDLKNPRWGMGIRHSQTRQPKRLAALLLIGTLLSFALWIIGIVAQSRGYRMRYGSKPKSAKTVSIVSLARQWLADVRYRRLTHSQLREAMQELASLVLIY